MLRARRILKSKLYKKTLSYNRRYNVLISSSNIDFIEVLVNKMYSGRWRFQHNGYSHVYNLFQNAFKSQGQPKCIAFTKTLINIYFCAFMFSKLISITFLFLKFIFEGYTNICRSGNSRRRYYWNIDCIPSDRVRMERYCAS